MTEEITRRKQVLGTFGLFLAPIIWGFTYIVNKDSTSRLPVIYILGMRYLIGSLAMLLCFFWKLKKLNQRIIWQGAILAVLISVSQFLQGMGVKYTAAGKTAFLSAMYVVWVPLLCWLLQKKKLGKYSIIAAVLALVGIGVMSLQGDISFRIGDVLILICSVGLALRIVFISIFIEENDSILLSMMQLVFSALFTWIAIGIARVPFPMQVFEPALLLRMGYLGVIATMAVTVIQLVFQRYVKPNVASVILSLEAVFGMLFSILLLGERLTVRVFAGAVIMMTAILLAKKKE